jgi:anthranilate phosphoribosyltransferase
VPEATALSALWRGRGENSYGEAAVIGTAAAALLTLGRASDADTALALARDYWRRRGAWPGDTT